MTAGSALLQLTRSRDLNGTRMSHDPSGVAAAAVAAAIMRPPVTISVSIWKRRYNLDWRLSVHRSLCALSSRAHPQGLMRGASSSRPCLRTRHQSACAFGDDPRSLGNPRRLRCSCTHGGGSRGTESRGRRPGCSRRNSVTAATACEYSRQTPLLKMIVMNIKG